MNPADAHHTRTGARSGQSSRRATDVTSVKTQRPPHGECDAGLRLRRARQVRVRVAIAEVGLDPTIGYRSPAEAGLTDLMEPYEPEADRKVLGRVCPRRGLYPDGLLRTGSELDSLLAGDPLRV
jgi:hypothetical protein